MKRVYELAVCLLALSRLEYPHDHFEVIVVDDSSRISPKTVVDSMPIRLPQNGALEYDPVHVRLPPDTVRVSETLP